MNEPKPLNSLEVWVADHATPIFLTLAVVILVAAGGIFWTYQKTGNAEDSINILRPKVAHIVKCNQGSLVDDKRAAECANRIRIGLINCRRSVPCREALLAAIASPAPTEVSSTGDTNPPASGAEGGATQNPSTAGQQPGPGQPGHHGGGDHHATEGGDGEEAPAGVPSPSPVEEPVTAPAPLPGATEGESGPQTGQENASPSGVGVELCVLERTCVDLEVGAHPKGTP